MNINIHIDRLILEGVSVTPSQRPMLQAVVEAELGRLLAENGLASELQAGGVVPRVPGGMIELASGGNSAQLGQQIARAVYQGIGE